MRYNRVAFATGAMMAAAIFLFSMRSEAGPLCPKGDELKVRLPDPVSGRQYEIYVSLPADYAMNSDRSYPLVIIADGGRAFSKLKCDARTLENGKAIRQSIIVGLSYALGDDLQDSRRRDYTPAALPKGGKLYGGAAAYQRYLRDVVLRYVEDHYRVAPTNRIFWGHSYGGLFGAHILLTEPSLFQTYVLGSPSFWFANEAIYDLEARYAETNRQLSATVFLYVGGLETARYDPARKGRTRDMISGMQKFEERLQARRYEGLQISSIVITGKDHVSSVRPGFGWALKAALRD
ncbi:putative alpha/beta superfamily hydrolase [Sinorhizobium kostiense]|uniref:Alpha/beta superfamily hydrolase n=1 Tax=Sinorhizobium kostiense TaxID=76747 RepID=A0ABS4R7I6_9HYPH|nr:alpha/beta hydrolase-fold protein [Sinorhizobium kostiense]MBP2238855.1 putative alpha/beta superfamily hydrolase [Sinorhizobium kostiense]